MTILSKLKCNQTPERLGMREAIPYTCYEIGHTWDTSCLRTYLNVFKTAFSYSLKIYSTLYLLGFILKWRNLKKSKKKALKNLVSEILQSSFFLSMNATYFLIVFCLYRKIFGSYHGFAGVIIGAVCSALSIILERKSRRGLLAVYVFNLAIETLFKMMVSRGMVRSIENGEVYLFAASMAAYMGMFRSSSLPKSVQSLLEKIFGCEETRYVTHETGDSSLVKLLPRPFLRTIKSLDARLNSVGKRNEHCHHNEGCFAYVVKSASRNFLIGYSIDILLNSRAILKKIFIERGPYGAGIYLMDFSLGKFIGAFTLIFKLGNCLLRWMCNCDHPTYFGAVSGLLAGLSAFFYKSSTISMYLFCKLLEILCMKAVRAKWLPYVAHADSALYSASLGVLFHAAIFEPHNIRPAYWRFLCNLSGQKFKEMFRLLLDAFGTNASRLYPDFIPKLDPRFVKSDNVKRILEASGKFQ